MSSNDLVLILNHFQGSGNGLDRADLDHALHVALKLADQVLNLTLTLTLILSS